MGKFTDDLVKRGKKPTDPPPYGNGAAALRVAIVDSEVKTLPEALVAAYGGDNAVIDFVAWADKCQANQSYLLEPDDRADDLIAYFDPTLTVVMVRETPKGQRLPYSHPVAEFMPDPSLQSLMTEDMIE